MRVNKEKIYLSLRDADNTIFEIMNFNGYGNLVIIRKNTIMGFVIFPYERKHIDEIIEALKQLKKDLEGSD